MELGRETTFNEPVEQLNQMIAEMEAKARELARAYKAAATAGTKLPGEDIIRITGELEDLKAKNQIVVDELQHQIGISSEEIRVLEQADHPTRPSRVDELWRADILNARPTEDLDDLLELGLENLLSTVRPEMASRRGGKVSSSWSNLSDESASSGERCPCRGASCDIHAESFCSNVVAFA